MPNMPRKHRSRRPTAKRITAEQFREARLCTSQSREDVADFLGVSLRTIGHWETGKARPTYAAYRLLRIHQKGELVDPAWSAFRLQRGLLITPEGHTFTPGEMTWQSLIVQRARFNSLPRVLAVAALRSGGRSGHVDSLAVPGAVLGAGQAVSQPSPPSIPEAVRGLPPSNRGVSEAERLAQGVRPARRRAKARRLLSARPGGAA